MPWVVPANTHAVGDTGHTNDHNAMATDLALIAAALPVVNSGLSGATAATRFAGGTVSGAPSSGVFATGDFVIDQSGNIWICTVAGSPGTWVLAGTGGGGTMINPMTTTGDLIKAGSGGSPQRLGIGSAGQFLTVSGGAPAWTTAGVVDWLNVVTQYGADPTGTADATTAIQNAINAGTGPVYLPAGTYKISSPLTLANGTIIIGDSDGGYGGAYPPGITEITLASGSNCSMILAPATANYWKLSGLLLNANGAGQAGPAQTGTAGAALHVEDGGSPAELQAELDAVYIEDSYNDGLYIGLNRRALYARRCKFIESGKNGSTVYGAGSGVTCNYSDHVFDACQVGSSLHHGYNLTAANASSIRITNGDIYGNGQDWAAVTPTTVAAGSNGQAVSGLTGAGVLNVASTSGFPSAGSLLINVSTGQVAVSYTGTSGGNQFTGVVVSATQGNQGGTLATGQGVYLLGGDAIHVGSQCSGIYIAGNSLDRNLGCGVFAETSVVGVKITGNRFTSNSAAANGLLPHLMMISPQANGVTFAGNGVEPLASGYSNLASYVAQCNGTGRWYDVANSWASSYVSTGSYTNLAAGLQPFSNGTFLVQSNNTGTVTQQVKALSGQTADLTQWQNSGGTPLAKVDDTGAVTAPLLAASGLTGAVAAARFVGGTASGAPTSGTFAVGDFVIDQTGHIYICTTAGTPGTWANAGSSSGVSTFNSRSGAVVPGNADYLAVASGGLTGATTATRFVGGTASAAPSSGTFSTGDFVVTQSGLIFICTAGGSPGTWSSGYALLSGATMTGYLAPAVVALTFVGSGTTLVNAALGNDFRLTVTASTTTIGNPSNPVDGQRIDFTITQGGAGSFTVAWGGNYDFGAAGTPTLSTAAGAIDIIGFVYNAAKGKWLALGAAFGF
jgi:hypothetical protein